MLLPGRPGFGAGRGGAGGRGPCRGEASHTGAAIDGWRVVSALERPTLSSLGSWCPVPRAASLPHTLHLSLSLPLRTPTPSLSLSPFLCTCPDSLRLIGGMGYRRGEAPEAPREAAPQCGLGMGNVAWPGQATGDGRLRRRGSKSPRQSSPNRGKRGRWASGMASGMPAVCAQHTVADTADTADAHGLIIGGASS